MNSFLCIPEVALHRLERTFIVLGMGNLQRAARARQAPALNFEHVAGLVPGLIAVYNVHTGQYRYISPAVQKLLGYDPALLQDKGAAFIMSLVHPNDQQRVAAENEAALTAANQHPIHEPIVNFEYRLRHADGSWVWLQTSGAVYSREPDGTVGEVINVSVDITHQKSLQHKLEEDIRERSEHLRLAQQIAKVASFEWDIPANTIQCTPEMAALYGLPPTGLACGYDQWLKRIHPDDRPQVASAMHAFIEQETPLNIEFRTIWKDGTIRWLLCRGHLIRDRGGRPERLIGIAMDITERTQLMTLNDAKDEFISLASHQLRTPATTVKQYLGMLLEGFVDQLTTKQHDMLQLAYDSNERQLDTINDLLRVANADAGKLQPHTELVDLGLLAKGAVDEQRHEFTARDQTITCELPGMAAVASADPQLIRMVIENLVTNAYKYSKKDAATQVRIKTLKTRVVISVQDQGVGIRKKDQEKLFQKFSRIDNSLSAFVGGSGLGLYWSKKIVDMHGGMISVTSALHKGSTFTVSLPRYA